MFITTLVVTARPFFAGWLLATGAADGTVRVWSVRPVGGEGEPAIGLSPAAAAAAAAGQGGPHYRHASAELRVDWQVAEAELDHSSTLGAAGVAGIAQRQKRSDATRWQVPVQDIFNALPLPFHCLLLIFHYLPLPFAAFCFDLSLPSTASAPTAPALLAGSMRGAAVPPGCGRRPRQRSGRKLCRDQFDLHPGGSPKCHSNGAATTTNDILLIEKAVKTSNQQRGNALKCKRRSSTAALATYRAVIV